MILKLKMILVVVVHHLRLNFQGKVLRKLYLHSCLGTGYFLKTTRVKKLQVFKNLDWIFYLRQDLACPRPAPAPPLDFS